MSGWGAGIHDFDNDGYKDLFTANSHVSENADIDPQKHYRQPNAVFRNLHDGTFQDVSREAGAGLQIRAAHRGCAFGDLNNDGKIDVVVSAIGSPAELLYNTSTDDQSLDSDQDRGRQKQPRRDRNADQADGELRAWSSTTMSRPQEVTRVRPIRGFTSDLGADAVIKEIELKWPSGTVQVLRNVKADQILTVTEESTPMRAAALCILFAAREHLAGFCRTVFGRRGATGARLSKADPRRRRGAETMLAPIAVSHPRLPGAYCWPRAV